MSQQNVEIVRRALAAALRKPTPDFAAVNALFHPDHELVSLVTFDAGPSARGAKGFRDWLASTNEAFGALETRVGEAKAVDDSRVVLGVSFAVAGRSSGVPIKQETGVVMTVKNALIVRTETFTSFAEALKAVGLEE